MFASLRATVASLLGGVLLPTQVETFIAVLTGLLLGRQAGIAAIGEEMLGEATAKSKKNRVFRFVSNPRINVERICNAIMGGLGMFGKRVVVATDWTEIGPLSVLTSAVVTDGRAIPIFWTVIDTLHTRKLAVEVDHMRKLSELLIGIDAIHVLDRGFDRGEFLKSIGTFCKYVVRLSCGFGYRKRGESEFRMIDQFPIKRGRRHDLGEIEYTKAHAVRCRLVVLHDHNQKEPWLLATNRYRDDRAVIIGYYGLRFRVEESFKDLKDIRGGFGLHGYRMEKPEHLSRLLALVVVGYLFVTASGHYGEENGRHRSLQSNTRKERELAAWRVGLKLLKENEITAEQLLWRMPRLPIDLHQHPDDEGPDITPHRAERREDTNDEAA